MSVVVFSGPTLRVHEVEELLPGAICVGPAGRGDVLRAMAWRPRAICLIDGVFDQRAAVLHKELLWALHQGIGVFGAASMGALRATELAPLGMVGWGEVFRRFASGQLENDDEVTVTHAAAEYDFEPSSAALVNLRVTLERAQAQRVASSDLCDTLLDQLGALSYPQRSFPQLIALARAAGSHEGAGLAHWLQDATHRVDQKHDDACSLLAHLRQSLARPLPATTVEWSFAYTSAWHDLVTEVRAAPTLARRRSVAVQPAHESATDAFLRSLLFEEVQLLGPRLLAETILACSYRAHGLTLARDLTLLDAARRREAEANLLQEARALAFEQLEPTLAAQGNLDRVRERALRKLSLCGTTGESPEADAAMLAWYFARLGGAAPLDLEAHARQVGFLSERQLRQAIAREYRFVHRA